MANINGFWSYVHLDDDADAGRIAQLARDVASQFEMLTGEPINLFLDRDELVWGDDWRATINESLSSVAFFVPVITPRYFKSSECRRELNFFARRAEKLGVKELVLPLLWVNVRELKSEDPSDDLMGLVKRFQWEDWTDLKFEELKSGNYRRAVSQLAERLVEANENAEKVLDTAQLEILETNEVSDEPGTLDKLATMETALPKMTEILNDASLSIQLIGTEMKKATQEITENKNPTAQMARRLKVARALAHSLEEPASNIRELGNQFSSTLNEVDEGVRIIIAQAPAETESDPESVPVFEDFFDTIRKMFHQAEFGLGSLQSMAEQTGPMEKISRDLRHPMRTINTGLTFFVDGLQVMRGWVDMIDEMKPLSNG